MNQKRHPGPKLRHPQRPGAWRYSRNGGEEKYRLIFNDAQVGLFRSSIEEGKILESNDCLARMFGYRSRKDFAAEAIISRLYVDPEARGRLLGLLREQGEVQGYEARFYRKDGGKIWLRYSGRIHPGKGYIEGVVVDVTEQKLTESALRAANRHLEQRVEERTLALRRLNRKLKAEIVEHSKTAATALERQQQLIQADKMASLGTLLSGMAHEINNPAGLILVNVPVLKDAVEDALELLDERLEPGENPRIAGLPYGRMRERLPKILETVERSARRIGRTIEDLRDFSRKSDPAERVPVDVNARIDSAARLCRRTLKEATGHFHSYLSDALPRVAGNPQRLEQVLVNLLLNAAQALGDPEEAIEVRSWSADGDVFIRVRDEGSGIAPEDLPRVLEPFFTTRRKLGGTGLGLWLCASIIEQHGGELSIESAPGEGTRVRIRLPGLAGDAP